MPEARKKVAPKTYVSRYLSFSCSFMVTGDDGEKSSDTIRFVNGEFTTSFEDEQKHLEGIALVSVKPSPRAALEAKALSLRAIAVKANAEAKAAEEAVAALDPKPAKTAA